MNPYRKWFKIVVWIGVLGNWTFAFVAMFLDPDRLLASLRLGGVDSTIWLFNYSVLLTLLSCFYIPAANDPVRYRANAWLLVCARLIPASTFFIGAALGFMPKGFLMLGLGDGTIGLIELLLLTGTLRFEARRLELQAG